MPVSEEFEKWATSFAGCDGGDIGSPRCPTTWVCGIEWGGIHSSERLRTHMQQSLQHAPSGYSGWEENISYIFNWQIMKLLAAMKGSPVEDYKQFAENTMPFVEGGSGYFKMNLYPIAFRSTNLSNWLSEFENLTGFISKDEYLAWCNDNRLSKIRNWAKEHLPELIICLGKTYRNQFGSAFSVLEGTWVTEIIDEKELNWAVNEHGSLVVVLPFMVNRYGLVRNSSIQKFGKRINELKANRALAQS